MLINFIFSPVSTEVVSRRGMWQHYQPIVTIVCTRLSVSPRRHLSHSDGCTCSAPDICLFKHYRHISWFCCVKDWEMHCWLKCFFLFCAAPRSIPRLHFPGLKHCPCQPLCIFPGLRLVRVMHFLLLATDLLAIEHFRGFCVTKILIQGRPGAPRTGRFTDEEEDSGADSMNDVMSSKSSHSCR